MKLHSLPLLGAPLLALLFTGCATGPADKTKALEPAKPAESPSVTVIRATTPVKLDGKLEEAFWKDAPAVELVRYDNTASFPPKSRERALRDPFNGGRCRFAWDDKYLYVGVDLIDRDVNQTMTGDQKYHFKYGDTFEFFIANTANSPYWELYATPCGNKSMLYFLAPLMPDAKENLHELPGYTVAAYVNGKLNDASTPDAGWSAELRIPLASLEQTMGVKFAPGAPFTCLVARYNFSRELRWVQNSSFPKMPSLNFHLVEYYAPMDIRR